MRIVTTSVASLFGNGFRVAVSFVAAILAIRLLGAAEFGLASAVMAHTALFHYALSMGLDHTLPTVDDFKSLSRRTILGIVVALSFGVLTVVSFASLAPFPDRLLGLIGLLGIAAVFTASSVILSGYLRATRDFKALIIKDQFVVPIGTLFASSVALSWFGRSANVYAAFYLLTVFSAFTYGLWRWRTRAAESKFDDLASERKFLIDSAPIAVTLVLENAVPFGIIAVVAYVLGTVDVGVFSSLQRFGQLAIFASLALSPIVSGLLSDLLRNAAARAATLFRIATVVSLSWALGITCACVILRDQISLLIALNAAIPLIVLLPLVLGFALDGAFGHVKLMLIAKHDSAANAKMITAAAFVAIAGAYAGTLLIGLPGASLALLAAYVVLTVLRVVRMRQTVGVYPLSAADLLKLVTAGWPLIGLTYAAELFEIPLGVRLSVLIAASGYWAWTIFRAYGAELTELRSI
jgi:O-antigen/teichoic acid export membrane protein